MFRMTIDLKKNEIAVDKVLKEYFHTLEVEGSLKKDTVNDNDIEYLTDSVLKAVLNA